MQWLPIYSAVVVVCSTRLVAMENEMRMLRQRCNAIESYHQKSLDQVRVHLRVWVYAHERNA